MDFTYSIFGYCPFLHARKGPKETTLTGLSLLKSPFQEMR